MKWLLPLLIGWTVLANELDEKTVVLPAQPKHWTAFPLSQVRLLPDSPFHRAMQISQQYLLDMDINRMLDQHNRATGADESNLGRVPYPGSNQPADTRPGDCPHYISGASLMYAQTGDVRFLERVNHLIAGLAQTANESSRRQRRQAEVFEGILAGELELKGPDELGYPWGGMGNLFYGIHKWMAAYRDAYLHCGNTAALQLWLDAAEPIVDFALQANPDLFDGMLDIEHGGMNEVFADLYALIADPRYLETSRRFNHQKVILNIADGRDVLYGRHANMQVPTFVGTARQYQLAGDPVSHLATANFLDMVYRDHMTCIGGNSRYERFGRPGQITKRLGYTSCETCNTYNLLKVALQHFQSTGELRHMDYFERALYNHILASQDPESGGVTYYTSLMPGGFKSYSNRFDLAGIWCCVGTGMENHSKYGEGIFFHNHRDLLVNLFIPSTLHWPEKGLTLRMETRFPAEDRISIIIEGCDSFARPIYVRYPAWTDRPARVWLNGKRVPIAAQRGGLIRLFADWKAGDRIELELPQGFRLEPAPDDPHMAAILHGPLVLAGELGRDRMPGSDRVQRSLQYKDWIPPTDDIPILVADKVDPGNWIQPVANAPLQFRTTQAGRLGDENRDVQLRPYHALHHQRYNVYWKLYSPQEFALRQRVVSDEINPASLADEQAHQLQGDGHDRSPIKDQRHFWENNRFGRLATEGGWFSYRMELNPEANRHYLKVTYWGGAEKECAFDVLVNGHVLAAEQLDHPWPLTYFEEIYEVPEDWVAGKDSVTVRFQARPDCTAGPVFGLQWTADPARFPGYAFY